MTPPSPSTLIDCNGSANNELFVVEGVSAANAIKSVRDRRFQAVLPMQGKILNASKVSEQKLLAHPNIADLLQSLHPQRIVDKHMDQCRYQQIIILGDPDADGVHASLLLLLFFYRIIPSLIEQNRLVLLRAPLYGFYQSDDCVAIAYSDAHSQRVHADLMQSNAVVVKRRFKGIASFDISLREALLASDNPARKLLSLSDCKDLCQALLR